MSETPALLLLGPVILLIFAAIGIFVGVLVYFQRERSKKETEQQAAAPPPQPVAKAEVPSLTPEAKEGASEIPAEMPARPGEVMRVIRDEQTGRVVIEVEGQQYAHIREIRDARVGRRVLWAIADLIRFTGGMAANPQAVRSVSRAEEASFPLQPTASALERDTTQEPEPPPSVSPRVPAAAAAAAPAPALQREAQPVRDKSEPALTPDEAEWQQARRINSNVQEPEAGPRRTGVMEFFRRGFQSSEPSTPVRGPSSFIDEIEEILQARISRRPEPLPYSVHVKAGEGGSLEIQVGLDSYGSPDEVPDPQVRELIKAAVEEWERQ